MRKHRATIRDAAGYPATRYVNYEYACTCGAVGGRSSLLSEVRRAREAHLRNAHGQ